MQCPFARTSTLFHAHWKLILKFLQRPVVREHRIRISNPHLHNTEFVICIAVNFLPHRRIAHFVCSLLLTRLDILAVVSMYRWSSPRLLRILGGSTYEFQVIFIRENLLQIHWYCSTANGIAADIINFRR